MSKIEDNIPEVYLSGYHLLTSKTPNLYEQLYRLNPALLEKKPGEMVELLDAIGECGYEWDDSRQLFYNSEIENGVRMQGLDMFTGERFREAHEVWNKRIESPEFQEWHKTVGMTKKLLYSIGIFILGGWIFLPIKYWIGISVFLVASYLLVDSTYLQKKRDRRDTALKE